MPRNPSESPLKSLPARVNYDQLNRIRLELSTDTTFISRGPHSRYLPALTYRRIAKIYERLREQPTGTAVSKSPLSLSLAKPFALITRGRHSANEITSRHTQTPATVALFPAKCKLGNNFPTRDKTSALALNKRPDTRTRGVVRHNFPNQKLPELTCAHPRKESRLNSPTRKRTIFFPRVSSGAIYKSAREKRARRYARKSRRKRDTEMRRRRGRGRWGWTAKMNAHALSN